MNAIMNNVGISLTAARQMAPAIFADAPKPGVSANYTFIPTEPIVRSLNDDGWVIVDVKSGGKGRGKNREVTPFSEHMIRLTRAENLVPETAKAAQERFDILMVNSHDRTRRFSLHAGIFRLICSNGMIVADSRVGAPVRITHYNIKQTTDEFVAGARNLATQTDSIMSRVDDFKRRELSRDEVLNFASAAIKLRYHNCITPLAPATLADNCRRPDDQGTDLWRVYNRVQEHLVVGGLFTGSRHTKPMVSLTENLAVNRGLWRMAAAMVDGDFDKVCGEMFSKN